jgi:hypothetical protein
METGKEQQKESVVEDAVKYKRTPAQMTQAEPYISPSAVRNPSYMRGGFSGGTAHALPGHPALPASSCF